MTRTLKLRIISWSVVGLALFQVVFGRYDFYPFIHWTMFANKPHKTLPTNYKETVLVGIGQSGQEAVIKFPKLFNSIPGGSGAAKSVADRYAKRLRKGDATAAQTVADLVGASLKTGPIAAIRVEEWVWQVDLQKFESGQPRDPEQLSKPDSVTALVTIPVTSK